MNADLAHVLLAILVPLAVLLAITAVISAATRIVRGWDALAARER